MNLISNLVCLGFVLHQAVQISAIRRLGIRNRRFIRGTPGAGNALLFIAAVFAGMGFTWFADAAAGAASPTAATLIAFVLLLHRWSRTELDSMGANSLAFISCLLESLEAGQSLFEAIASAGTDLPEGPLSAAVDAALERNADRLPIPTCLEPLYLLGGSLRDLAVDVSRAAPGAMNAVVRSVYRRTTVRWDRRGRKRRQSARLANRMPLLYAVATGAGLFSLVENIGAWVALSWLIAIHIWLSSGLQVSWRRWAFLGSSLAAVAMLAPWGTAVPSFGEPLVQVRTYSPMTAVRVRPERLPAEPLAWIRPVQISLTDPPDRPLESPIQTCRVATGVPDGWAHVRSSPRMDSGVLFYVREGEHLHIESNRGDWRAVRRKDGEHGWIFEPLCIGSTPGEHFKISVSVGE